MVELSAVYMLMQTMRASVSKSDDEAESPTSACHLDTATTDPIWPALQLCSQDADKDVEIAHDDCSHALPPMSFLYCEPPRDVPLLAHQFDPCGRSLCQSQGRWMTLMIGLMRDPANVLVVCAVQACLHLESTLGDAGTSRPDPGTCDASMNASARSGNCEADDQTTYDALRIPSRWLCAGNNAASTSSRSPADQDNSAAYEASALRQNDAQSHLSGNAETQSTVSLPASVSPLCIPVAKAVQEQSWSTSPALRAVDQPRQRHIIINSPSSVAGPITPELDEWVADVRGNIEPQGAHDSNRISKPNCGAQSTADSSCGSSEARPCFLSFHDTALPPFIIEEAQDDVCFTGSHSLLLGHSASPQMAIPEWAEEYPHSKLQPQSTRCLPILSAAFARSPEAPEEQGTSFQSQPASLLVSDDAQSPPRIATPLVSSYDCLPNAPMGPDDGEHGVADDTEIESRTPQGSSSIDAPVPQASTTMHTVREQHPDVPLRGVAGRAAPQLAQLDQHLLDRVLLKVAAGSSSGALNAAAVSCRRLRNAVRRIAGSAGPPTLDSAPPVDAATAALDIRALHSFPSLHTLRLPKLDRGIPTLPVDLFRLRHLTLLTHLDVACAAAVPSFQPLRLLPNLRKLSVSGVTLAPPPDIPDIPGCDVTLYANRALAAATRGHVLRNLPPLSGLRVASKAPSALLQQIGNAHCCEGLTYLRLGCCNMPQLAPLATLSKLARLHLHMLRGQVGPLASLSQLTYLHLHGSVEDLPQSLGFFRKLQKLSLIKCRRLRPDEVRAIGTLSELTSLELPHSKAMHALRDVRPLSRLMSLQHLSLAMPDSGIAPLIGLTSLTFLRLKCRMPSTDVRQPTNSVPLAAGLFTPPFILCNLATSDLSTPGAVVNAAATSVAESTVTVAFALACAAMTPLAVYAAKRMWRAIAPAPAELRDGSCAGRLSDLAQMQQLEWLEVKSSTLPTAAEWSAALAPLTRLRRLDVRNTAFQDVTALRNMTHLSVLLVAGCSGLPRSDRVLRDKAGLSATSEVRR